MLHRQLEQRRGCLPPRGDCRKIHTRLEMLSRGRTTNTAASLLRESSFLGQNLTKEPLPHPPPPGSALLISEEGFPISTAIWEVRVLQSVSVSPTVIGTAVGCLSRACPVLYVPMNSEPWSSEAEAGDKGGGGRRRYCVLLSFGAPWSHIRRCPFAMGGK